MKDVVFLEKIGKNKKGTKKSLPTSTAQALADKKLVKIEGDTPKKTETVDGLKKTVYDRKK